MCTVKIKFVLLVAVETVKSHMTQMGVFLRTFFFSFSFVNNLAPMRNCPGKCRPPAYWHFYAVFFRRVNILAVLKMDGVILSDK